MYTPGDDRPPTKIQAAIANVLDDPDARGFEIDDGQLRPVDEAARSPGGVIRVEPFGSIASMRVAKLERRHRKPVARQPPVPIRDRVVSDLNLGIGIPVSFDSEVVSETYRQGGG